MPIADDTTMVIMESPSTTPSTFLPMELVNHTTPVWTEEVGLFVNMTNLAPYLTNATSALNDVINNRSETMDDPTVNSTQEEKTACLVVSSISRYREEVNEVLSPRVVDAVQRPLLAVAFFIVVAGIVGNMINMAVFKKLGLKERINICLFWLAFADFMSLLYHLLVYGEKTVQAFANKKEFTNGPWRMVVFNYHLVYTAGFRHVSFFMTALVSMERCICVTWPLKSKVLLRNRPTLTAIFFGSLILLGLQFFQATKYYFRCALVLETGETTYLLEFSKLYRDNMALFDEMTNVVQGVAVWSIFNALVITTTTVTIISLRRRALWHQQTVRNQADRVSSRDVTLSKMLVIVSCIYVFCTTPTLIHRILYITLPGYSVEGELSSIQALVFNVSNFLILINSSVNIIVYYTHGSRYKEQFQSLFSCCLKGRRSRAANDDGGERGRPVEGVQIEMSANGLSSQSTQNTSSSRGSLSPSGNGGLGGCATVGNTREDSLYRSSSRLDQYASSSTINSSLWADKVSETNAESFRTFTNNPTARKADHVFEHRPGISEASKQHRVNESKSRSSSSSENSMVERMVRELVESEDVMSKPKAGVLSAPEYCSIRPRGGTTVAPKTSAIDSSEPQSGGSGASQYSVNEPMAYGSITLSSDTLSGVSEDSMIEPKPGISRASEQHRINDPTSSSSSSSSGCEEREIEPYSRFSLTAEDIQRPVERIAGVLTASRYCGIDLRGERPGASKGGVSNSSEHQATSSGSSESSSSSSGDSVVDPYARLLRFKDNRVERHAGVLSVSKICGTRPKAGRARVPKNSASGSLEPTAGGSETSEHSAIGPKPEFKESPGASPVQPKAASSKPSS